MVACFDKLSLGQKNLTTNLGAGPDFGPDFGSNFSLEFWPEILAQNFDQISAAEIAAWILMTIWSHIIVASTNHVIVYRCGHGLKSL